MEARTKPSARWRRFLRVAVVALFAFVTTLAVHVVFSSLWREATDTVVPDGVLVLQTAIAVLGNVLLWAMINPSESP